MTSADIWGWESVLAMEGTERLFRMALETDIGSGDITSESIFSGPKEIRGAVVAREPVVVCGGPLALALVRIVDPNCGVTLELEESQWAEPGSRILSLSGDARSIFRVERCLLNFMMRLCAIATKTRRTVELIPKGSPTQILDTRKTLPGWRHLDKIAVKVGGGKNHRQGLFDAVLIKDNHIAAAGGIDKAVKLAKRNVSEGTDIEAEIDHLEQLEPALHHGANIILLDNFSDEDVAKAVELNKGRALLEVSGGVLPERIGILSRLGVDRISMGALTHSVKAADLGLDMDMG